MFWRLLFMVAVHPLTTEWVETLRFVKFLRGTKFVKSWIRNDEKQICSLVFHTCHSGKARLWGRFTEEKTQPGLFIRISYDPRPRLDWAAKEEDDSTGFIMALQEWLHDATAAPQQSNPTHCCCHCHVEPIFSSSPSSSSLSTHFCARSTFKALNIIHYNAVHSRLLAECGKCRICTSPPLSSPPAFYWPGATLVTRSQDFKSRGMYF